jgi:hypothetical protein
MLQQKNGSVILGWVGGDMHSATKNGSVILGWVGGDLHSATKNGSVILGWVGGGLEQHFSSMLCGSRAGSSGPR